MTVAEAPARPRPPDPFGAGDEGITPRKLVTTLVVLAMVGVGSYFGWDWWQERKERGIRSRLEACLPVPDQVAATISTRLVDVDGYEVRHWRASSRGPSHDAETWFMSVEIVEPGLARGASGEILTWAGGLESGSTFVAVEENAREHSSWPAAADNIKVTDDGGLESRYCVRAARDKKFRAPGEEGYVAEQ